MTQKGSDIINLTFDGIVHQTPNAVQFYFSDEKEIDLPENEIWLPRFLISFDENTRRLSLPKYLAQEKGLI
jgi:hypothetical protein